MKARESNSIEGFIVVESGSVSLICSLLVKLFLKVGGG